MGAGFAQVGLLLLLTVFGLPLFFFGLMAALDKFERSFSPQPRMAATPPAAGSPADLSAASAPSLAVAPEAAVVALPALPVATAANATAASKPAAAV